MKTMRVLFIGDIMGKPGRKAVQALLPSIKKENKIDLVIANAENLAHGKGVTRSTIAEMTSAGVDFFTSGNHIWSKPEGVTMLSDTDPLVIRPANYPVGVPGLGKKRLTIGKNSILVVNLMGRVFMGQNLDCPFLALDAILESCQDEPVDAIIVDFHAETTSEKNAFGLYANGRVSAVVGTHTHIPTADDRVLPKGTAYITDLGMVGIRDSVIGIDFEKKLPTFLTQLPSVHEIPETGLVVFNSALIEIDMETGKAISMERVQRETVV